MTANQSPRAILKEKFGDNSYNDPENSFMDDGVLSTPQIEYYAKRYGIVENFDEKCLKAAVYEMRLGDQAVRWNDKMELKFNMLEKAPDSGENLLARFCAQTPGPRYAWPLNISTAGLILPPNSLTFVTIFEKFNLTRDIIARFNLKSVFVHKGLLLGGGPIIDPGYHSGIVVPLHNFSNIPVELTWREPLLKVEFTRTMNPDASSIAGIKVKSLVNERDQISDDEFLEKTRYVESSVYAAIEKNDNLVKSLSSRLRIASIASIIGLVALVASFYNLIINISNTAIGATAKLHETQEKMAAFSAQNERYLKKVDVQLGELIEELKRVRESGNAGELLNLEQKASDLKRELGDK